MATTSYAERARQFRARTALYPTGGDERNEVNEINTPDPPVLDSQETQRTCAVSAVSPERVYVPLDEVIAADVALKHDRAAITARVERLNARAGQPDATPLDRVVAADWRRILAAKEANE